MSLNRFGKHAHATIDKFGQSIHEHTITEHFAKPEVIKLHHKPIVFRLCGDGATDSAKVYFLIQNMTYTSEYWNYFYEGRIKDARMTDNVQMFVNSRPLNILTGNILQRGDIIRCKNKYPKVRKPFFVELLLEYL